ncbi:hypothetical protein [Rubrivirga marina]|uniref:Uncharacterized protein n=1 Tax=Rubrivirga marina TaxID=1196024 RepID=A0A271IWG8_9BACT|nr:hypothetical protein [Rubrivirga marina]PAP75457.1 hypothetical protein BSZ37_02850 [Rubrivirga marina]
MTAARPARRLPPATGLPEPAGPATPWGSDGAEAAARRPAPLDGGALPTGAYLVRLTTGAQTAAERLTLLG